MSARRKRPEMAGVRVEAITHRVAVLRASVDEHVASGGATDYEAGEIMAELDAISAELDQMRSGSRS